MLLVWIQAGAQLPLRLSPVFIGVQAELHLSCSCAESSGLMSSCFFPRRGPSATVAFRGTAASAQRLVKNLVVLHPTRMHDTVACLEVAWRMEVWPELWKIGNMFVLIAAQVHHSACLPGRSPGDAEDLEAEKLK